MNYEFIREKSLVITRNEDCSFFYAYFYAFRWFRNMSDKEQTDHIHTERGKMKISQKEWREKNRRLVTTFRDTLRRFWDDPYPLPFITLKKIRILLSVVSWDPSILDKEEPVDDQYIIDVFSETFTSDLERIESHELKTFSKEKKHLLQQCFIDIILFLWNKTIETSFLAFLKRLRDPDHDIDLTDLPFVMPYLTHNVVVLNESHVPYDGWDHDPTKEYIALILDDRGFHSVGSFQIMENTYKISRLFPSLESLCNGEPASPYGER